MAATRGSSSWQQLLRLCNDWPLWFLTRMQWPTLLNQIDYQSLQNCGYDRAVKSGEGYLHSQLLCGEMSFSDGEGLPYCFHLPQL